MILQLQSAIASVSMDPQTIGEFSNYAFYLVGVVLAVVILKRRMKYRRSTFTFNLPSRWSAIKEPHAGHHTRIRR